MERMTRLRARILLGLFAFIMVLYAMRLFNLQIISTDGNTDNDRDHTQCIQYHGNTCMASVL